MKGPAGLLCDLTSHPFASTPVISPQISLEHYSVFGLKASHGLPSLLIPTGPGSGLQSPNASDHYHAVVSFIFLCSRDLLMGQQADASTSLLEISAWKPVRQFTSIRKPPLTPRRAMEAPPLPIILGLPPPASASLSCGLSACACLHVTASTWGKVPRRIYFCLLKASPRRR